MTLEEKRERGRLAQARYRANNLELNRQRQVDWIKNLKIKFPEKYKLRHLKGNRRRFGLSPEEYDAKLASQNNICVLCKLPFDILQPALKPVLDHNHETGELRKFIHNRCNSAIGLLNDSSEMCRLAADYIERHAV